MHARNWAQRKFRGSWREKVTELGYLKLATAASRNVPWKSQKKISPEESVRACANSGVSKKEKFSSG